MRVIVLMNSLYTGGAEYSTLSFYQYLKAKGHEIRLVCLKQAMPSYDPLQFGFAEVQYLTGNIFQRLKQMSALIRSFRPHVIHSILFDANLLGRFCRIRFRQVVHLESLVNEMYSPYRLNDPRVSRWKLEGYRLLDKLTHTLGVDHFQANGESVARHYQAKVGISAKCITVIPRGRPVNSWVGDSANRLQVRAELNTGNRFMLMHVGRHEFQKAQDVLIGALHLLDNKSGVQLVLVGREGNFTNTLKQKIRDYHLEHVVNLLGHRADIPALLAAADVLVFPSRFEGLPGVLIEAEAAGLPIICSDIPNHREVVEEGKNALFFPVDDAQALASQITKLMADPGLRASMSVAGSRIFNERFSIGPIHERMEQLVMRVGRG
jgi:glycosyltransferase involved in cell wall biosynthesis